jgi:hypothetical protein
MGHTGQWTFHTRKRLGLETHLKLFSQPLGKLRTRDTTISRSVSPSSKPLLLESTHMVPRMTNSTCDPLFMAWASGHLKP